MFYFMDGKINKIIIKKIYSKINTIFIKSLLISIKNYFFRNYFLIYILKCQI